MKFRCFNQCIVAAALILGLLLLMGCSKETVEPRMLTMRKDGVTLHLFGTVHVGIPGHHDKLYDSIPRDIVDAVRNSDIIFLEAYGPGFPGAPEPTQEDIDIYLTWHIGTEEYPSVEEIISSWSEERRQDFLDTLDTYPGFTGHFGRKRNLLGAHPLAAFYFASRYSREEANSLSSGNYGVDAWVFSEAYGAGIPIAGIERYVAAKWTLSEYGIDQEYWMAYLEELLRLPMTKTIVREQEHWILSVLFDLWKRGIMHEDIRPEEKSFFREFFDLPEDSILLQCNKAYHYALLDMREKMWVETITKYLNTRWARQVFVAVGLAHLHPKHATLVQRLLDAGWELVGARPEIVDISEYYR